MNGKKASIYLGRGLLSSIAVLTVGFLGFGVRAFSTPDLTRLVFAGVVVVSIGILALYFILHRSTRESKVNSLPRKSTSVRRSVFSRAWMASVRQWMGGLGHSLLSRKAPMKPGECLGSEAGVVRVSKVPDSRRAA
jgi:hypothetical protein